MTSLTMNSTPINRDVLNHLALDVILPWHENEEQFERFKKLTKVIVIPLMIFLIVMPLLPDFTTPPEVMKKVVTQLALDPPEVIPVPVEVPPPPKEIPKAEPRPVPTEKTSDPVKVKPKPKQQESSASSLAALSQQLSALSSAASVPQRQKKNVFVADAGKVQKSSRSLLGQKNATSSSSGLSASDVTINAKGGQVLEHQSGSVASPDVAVELPTEEQYHYDPKQERRRDMQSIRRMLERYKGSVYGLYTKALRHSPELNGRFIFKFTVLANGTISKLKLVSSELNEPNLEAQMLKIISAINFGSTDDLATPVEYTFTFLPS